MDIKEYQRTFWQYVTQCFVSPPCREAQRDCPRQSVLPLPAGPRCLREAVSSHQRTPLHGHGAADSHQIGPKDGPQLPEGRRGPDGGRQIRCLWVNRPLQSLNSRVLYAFISKALLTCAFHEGISK